MEEFKVTALTKKGYTFLQQVNKWNLQVAISSVEEADIQKS